jgi:divalent metal cation (Fe/Co/Zn/Cd) transporter
VLATIVVIVALAASRFGLLWVDGVAGIVVSLFIAWSALEPLKDAVNPLIGEAPSPQVLQEMRDAAMSVPGVEAVHDLIVHRYGELAVSSLHIEVDAALDICRGHELAEQVEQRLNERLAGWSVVHVDPVNRRHPLYQPIDRFLREMMPKLEGAGGFHDLRIIGSPETPFVVFDLRVDDDGSNDVVHRINEEVKARFPAVSKVVVNVEPRYVY